MVGQSNLLLLVATGENLDYRSDKIMIWDEKTLNVVLTLDMNEPVLSLSYANKLFFVGMMH